MTKKTTQKFFKESQEVLAELEALQIASKNAYVKDRLWQLTLRLSHMHPKSKPLKEFW